MGRFGSLLTIVCVSALAACTSGRPVEPQLVASPDTVSLMLAEAADKASSALETLAAVEQARTPAAEVGNIPDAPPELRRAMTVNWIGPVEPLARRVADRAGYTFMVIGNPPPVPMLISIDVQNRPIIDILRDIGLQMGLRADLKVDARRKAVEIQYAPHSGTGAPG